MPTLQLTDNILNTHFKHPSHTLKTVDWHMKKKMMQQNFAFVSLSVCSLKGLTTQNENGLQQKHQSQQRDDPDTRNALILGSKGQRTGNKRGSAC